MIHHIDNGHERTHDKGSNDSEVEFDGYWKKQWMNGKGCVRDHAANHCEEENVNARGLSEIEVEVGTTLKEAAVAAASVVAPTMMEPLRMYCSIQPISADQDERMLRLTGLQVVAVETPVEWLMLLTLPSLAERRQDAEVDGSASQMRCSRVVQHVNETSRLAGETLASWWERRTWVTHLLVV